jgi:3-oxoacyl-[acyl-carrier-protein] synthase II
MMKPVYVVDYLVKDCIGVNVQDNFLTMPNTPGATEPLRYNIDEAPNVLCKKGFHMSYVEKDYTTYKLTVDLCNDLIDKYPIGEIIPKDSAVIFGSFTSASKVRDEFVAAYNSGVTRYSPTRLFQGNHDLLSSLVAGKLKLEGINTSLNGACTSSMFNLHFAVMLIQTGQTSAAIVGNADMPIEAKMQYHWQCTSAISTLNGGSCAPFDKKRDGFLQGEGGTIWFICDEETLIKNNLTPKARIRAISSGAKVTSITAHDKTCENQLKIINQALAQSQLTRNDISFFNAHATSTLIGDDIEIDVFQKAFTDVDIPIVAFKGYIGHTMSACGLIESAYGLEAVKNGFVQGNYNLTEPLSDDPRIITRQTNLNSKIFMKASFGFGGRTNISIFESL